jgi:hypothetical protein
MQMNISGHRRFRSLLNLLLLLLMALFSQAQGAISQQAMLKAANAGDFDYFGSALAISADGTTLATGGYYEDGAGLNAGAVYIFVWDGAGWTQQAYLTADNGGDFDQFGQALALSADGNTLAVGALYEDGSISGDGSDDNATNSGAAYIFSRTDSNWTQQAYLKASNGEVDDFFGGAVALSGDGDTLAVAATNEDAADGDNETNNSVADSGAVYLFTRSSELWSQQTRLKASNPGIDDRFGSALSLSSDGGTLAVGVPSEDGGPGLGEGDDSAEDAGAVYLFAYDGSNWGQQALLKASNGEADDRFGRAVALSADGNSLAVGAPYESSAAAGDEGDNSQPDAGAVYLFTHNTGLWSQQALFKASNAQPSDLFGWSLALSADGRDLAVGAKNEDASTSGGEGDNSVRDAGAVYLFMHRSGIWSQRAYLKSSNPDQDDFFGGALGLSADANTLAVAAASEDSAAGAGEDDNSAKDAGAVYLFNLPDIHGVSAIGTGNGTINPIQQYLEGGAQAVLTVTANSGHEATVTGCSGSLSGETYTTGPITADCEVTATFTLKRYQVSASGDPNGQISPASQSVEHGTTASFTVTPDTGYTATASGCGGSLVGQTYTTGAITGPCQIDATFSLNRYPITATSGPNGQISPASQIIDHGISASFTLTPDTGYTAAVIGCGGRLDGDIYTTAPITGTCAVSATFSMNRYQVTATGGPNGEISPASQTIDHGTSASFTVTPGIGYTASVTGCGGTLSGDQYTTPPITDDCTIAASFTLTDDRDGVSAAIENGAPNGGDGNDDGILDSLQSRVTSFRNQNGDYITLVTDGECDGVRDVGEIDPPATDPAGYTFPSGLLQYRLPCGSANLTLLYHGLEEPDRYQYRWYGTGASGALGWQEIPNIVGTIGIGGQQVMRVEFMLNDQQPGDNDSAAGLMLHQGGLALLAAPTPPPAPVPITTRWGLLLLAIFMIFLAYRQPGIQSRAGWSPNPGLGV